MQGPEVFSVPGGGDAFAGGVKAGLVGAGGDALLTEFADVPVLAVGDIPEIGGVGWVELRLVEGIRMEEPIALDQSSLRRLRPELMNHDVVRMQAEEEIGVDGVVIDEVMVVSGEFTDGASAGAAAEGEAAAAMDAHVAAEEGAFGQVVFGGVGRRKFGELGMDERAMITLGIILEDEFPVGAEIVMNRFG